MGSVKIAALRTKLNPPVLPRPPQTPLGGRTVRRTLPLAFDGAFQGPRILTPATVKPCTAPREKKHAPDTSRTTMTPEAKRVRNREAGSNIQSFASSLRHNSSPGVDPASQRLHESHSAASARSLRWSRQNWQVKLHSQGRHLDKSHVCFAVAKEPFCEPYRRSTFIRPGCFSSEFAVVAANI
jgi:hypothetical protein